MDGVILEIGTVLEMAIEKGIFLRIYSLFIVSQELLLHYHSNAWKCAMLHWSLTSVYQQSVGKEEKSALIIWKLKFRYKAVSFASGRHTL